MTPPGVVGSTVESQALAVARDVATRTVRPQTLRAAIAASAAQSTFPTWVQWDERTVAQGSAGIALLCAAMDAAFPDEGWDRHGHTHLTQALDTATPGRGASLFSGAAGTGLTADLLAGGRPRYGRLLASVDRAVAVEVQRTVAWLVEQEAVPVIRFDAISGLAGATAYLLRRRGRSPDVDAALEAALAALATRLADSGHPPAWHTPVTWLRDEERPHYPHGNLNCGLAHGLPGPLAVLALAMRDGHRVPGGPQAVATAADWLVAHRVDDEWGPNWSNAVPLQPDGSAGRAPLPARAGWCYGAPGVARALWLAGEATGDAALRDLSTAAVRAVVARPAERRALTSPTFCHGTAGLLQVVGRFARDTGAADLHAAARDLCAEVLTAHDPTSVLGYRNVEPGGVLVDHPGLLDGAPGVALVLLAAGTGTDPVWDRLFLLS